VSRAPLPVGIPPCTKGGTGILAPCCAVLITAAAGGVGTCAVQAARLLGARVIAAAGSPEKLEVARGLGADALADYSRPDWPEGAWSWPGRP